jgi:fatty acid desaturase
MSNLMSNQFAIPERANIVIFFLALAATVSLLWLASHCSWGWALLAALLFAFAAHTPFSLLHESVHGIFSPNRLRNDFFGTLCAAMFPTSLTLQRVAHLGHHRRNRTDRELYDYYLPHQSRVLRNIWLYGGNLFGLYWACIPLSNLLYLLAPWLYSSNAFVRGFARHLGFEPYVEEIARQPKLRIWLECLFAFSYQAIIWWLLDLNWHGVLLCYGAFAIHWSALQYVDHAWSPRDIINGAWNLRVSPLVRLLALNYHYHLAHHRLPHIPWLYLPRFVKPEEPQPSFWSIYFSLWGGVRPAPPMVSSSTAAHIK